MGTEGILITYEFDMSISPSLAPKLLATDAARNWQKVSLISNRILRLTPTMLGVVHLVDEISHVIFAVDITSFAIFVSRFFDLVLNHRFMGREVSGAVFVAALDLARHR